MLQTTRDLDSFRLLVIHVGTNNVNRQRVSSAEQMASFTELGKLQKVLEVFQQQAYLAVVFSGIVFTRSRSANDRISWANDRMKGMCLHKWIDHSKSGLIIVTSPLPICEIVSTLTGRGKINR